MVRVFFLTAASDGDGQLQVQNSAVSCGCLTRRKLTDCLASLTQLTHPQAGHRQSPAVLCRCAPSSGSSSCSAGRSATIRTPRQRRRTSCVLPRWWLCRGWCGCAPTANVPQVVALLGVATHLICRAFVGSMALTADRVPAGTLGHQGTSPLVLSWVPCVRGRGVFACRICRTGPAGPTERPCGGRRGLSTRR